MECRARGPAAAAGYTAGFGALYKNLLVRDAILSLSLGSAVRAAAAALGGHKHIAPCGRHLGASGGATAVSEEEEAAEAGRGRKERKTDQTRIGRAAAAAAAAGARGDPALFLQR